MNRSVLAIGMMVAAFAAQANATSTEAALIGDSVFIRSEFGANRYLIRKVDLRSRGRGNEVVNFAGARMVSANGDVPFDRGYTIAQENDDATPLKFNGTYIGANHGAFFGVKIPCENCSDLTDTKWNDAEGTAFHVVTASKRSVILISDEQGKPGDWSFKLKAVGDLSQVGGVRVLRTENQERDQVYPSVKRISESVSGGLLGSLTEDYQPTNKVEVGEEYLLLSPAKGRAPVANVKVRYVFQGLKTEIYTEVKALSTLHSFSMGGAQAGAINFRGARLEQMVEAGATLSGWADRTDGPEALRVQTSNTVASQRVVGGAYSFGQTVGVISATINGKPAPQANRVDLSAARKMYPIAIEGVTLTPGDVVSVKAYRNYWPGEEPMAAN